MDHLTKKNRKVMSPNCAALNWLPLQKFGFADHNFTVVIHYYHPHSFFGSQVAQKSLDAILMTSG